MAITVKVDGVDLTHYFVYNSMTIEQRANAFVSTSSFQLIDKTADLGLAFIVKEKDVVLVEEGAVKHFAGTVANIETEALAEGKEALVYTVECQDYNLLVEEVVIDQIETYGASLDSTIIDDLFDKYLPEVDSHTPGGGGFVQSLHVFDEIEFFDITLREALDRIANEAGSTALTGYWYIDNDKYLHYFNEEDNAPAFYLSDTPDNVTSFGYLSDVSRLRDGATIANRILVVGAEMVLFVQDYDSYNYYGKWYEIVVQDNTVFSVDEVLSRGYSLLAKYAYPDEVFSINTRKAGLRAGMNVRFENALYGTSTRTNWVENPSFEINVADFWTFSQDGAGGSAAQSAVRAAIGTQSCLITASDAGDARHVTDNIVLADDETISVQTRVYRPTATACSIVIYDVTTAAVRATIVADITAGWQMLTTSWKNETGGAVNVSLRLINGAGDGASEVWFDGCMAEIEKGPYPLDYIDGTYPFCAWAGAAHDSTSSRLPVYTIRELTLTWPENTATYHLELGGRASDASLISSRTQAGYTQRGLGPVVPSQVPVSSRGWDHNLVFSPAANPNEHNKLDWGSGTITTADGTVYSIVAGTTGVVADPTYIYLDTDTSLTVLQTTTTASAAVGRRMILLAIMEDVAVDPDADVTQDTAYKVFGGGIPSLITANEIVANSIETGNIKAGAITTDELFALSVTAAKIATNTITANKLDMGMGDSLYNAADGLLLFGPDCEINITEWWTLRRTMATISGAFRRTAGYWPGSRAIAVETGATNLVLNPSFEVNVTDYWGTANVATFERSATHARFGDYSARVYEAVMGGNENVLSDLTAVVANEDYTFSLWIKKTICTGTGRININWYTAAPAFISQDVLLLDAGTHDWKRYDLTATAPATATQCRIYPFNFTGITVGTECEWFIDGVQFELAPYATPYFDGTFGTGYVWGGAAHNTASTRTKTEINLDDYVGLISGNNTLSFRCVVQMPFDADDISAPAVYPLVYRGANNDNYVALYYNGAVDEFYVWINGDNEILNGSTQTFKAGDWFDLVLTLDFTEDEYYLYVNGILDGSSTTALAAPTITEWNLGSLYNSTLQSGLVIAEFAAFDRILSAIEVAALYALGKPMVDLLPFDTPGIYILDGRFRIASSVTGNRIEIDSDEIAGYDSAGVKQFYLQSSDGVAYAGGGAVILDEDGITIEIGDDTENKIEFDDSGTIRGSIWAKTYGAGIAIYIKAGPPGTGDPSALFLQAYDQDDDLAGAASIEIHATHGANKGYISFWVEAVSPCAVYADGFRINTSKNLVFYDISGSDHYLYKNNHDIYWYNGTIGQKLN